MLSSDSCLRLSDDVTFQSLGEDGQAVLVSLTSGQLYTCNETTHDLLHAIDGQRSFGEVVDALAEMYDVERETLKADLGGMAEELIREGLILLKSEAPGADA